MIKASYYLSVAAAATGICLFLARFLPSFPVFPVLTVHVVTGLLLAVLLVRIVQTHVPVELSNPFKRGIKKWNGAKYLFYMLLAIGSGLFLLLRNWLFFSWVVYLHLIVGVWGVYMGWRHVR